MKLNKKHIEANLEHNILIKNPQKWGYSFNSKGSLKEDLLEIINNSGDVESVVDKGFAYYMEKDLSLDGVLDIYASFSELAAKFNIKDTYKDILIARLLHKLDSYEIIPLRVKHFARKEAMKLDYVGTNDLTLASIEAKLESENIHIPTKLKTTVLNTRFPEKELSYRGKQ